VAEVNSSYVTGAGLAWSTATKSQSSRFKTRRTWEWSERDFWGKCGCQQYK